VRFASRPCPAVQSAKQTATSSTSNALSGKIPHSANCQALAGSVIRGSRTPGVSSKSTPSSRLIQLTCRVTPARFSRAAFLRDARAFITEDLPVFGAPTTAARIRVERPGKALRVVRTARSVPARVAVVEKAFMPTRPSASSHLWVAACSAKSCLLSKTTRGLFRRLWCNVATEVAAGMRASLTSITRSMMLAASETARRPAAICPGNQEAAAPRLLLDRSDISNGPDDQKGLAYD